MNQPEAVETAGPFSFTGYGECIYILLNKYNFYSQYFILHFYTPSNLKYVHTQKGQSVDVNRISVVYAIIVCILFFPQIAVLNTTYVFLLI